ncbi:MAG TPA: hypothetical protein VN380_06605 [Thermoanaerobaculia bacterium]|jgi:hypothetical protein|nr:hypothetical protein [Thermoanaerobaculia bacterium]
MNSIEDAVLYIVSAIRQPAAADFASYGYDVYIPAVVRRYVRSRQLDPESGEGHQLKIHLSSLFFDAAWELARRGIIRPGIRKMGFQSTDEGSAGAGFSITPFGRKWLAEDTVNIWVSTEPDRFAAMIEPFRARFGDGFHSRAQEAVRSYGAHAYLACCTMCGAATESILLATAIEKTKDERKVLAAYSGSQGRSRVENMVVGKALDPLRREFLGLTSLLKYWRDSAGHGRVSTISENEAYTALALLLRYACVVNERWADLTT